MQTFQLGIVEGVGIVGVEIVVERHIERIEIPFSLIPHDVVVNRPFVGIRATTEEEEPHGHTGQCNNDQGYDGNGAGCPTLLLIIIRRHI